MELYQKITILSIVALLSVLLVLFLFKGDLLIVQSADQVNCSIDGLIKYFEFGVSEIDAGLKTLNNSIGEQQRAINNYQGIGRGRNTEIRSNIIGRQRAIVNLLQSLHLNIVGGKDANNQEVVGVLERLRDIKTRTTTGEFFAADKQYINQVLDRIALPVSQSILAAIQELEKYLKETRPTFVSDTLWESANNQNPAKQNMTPAQRDEVIAHLKAAKKRIATYQWFQKCKLQPPPATQPKPQPPPPKCDLKIISIEKIDQDNFRITIEINSGIKTVEISSEAITASGPPKNLFEPVRQAYEQKYNGGKPLPNCRVSISAEAENQCQVFRQPPKPPTTPDPVVCDNEPAVAPIPPPAGTESDEEKLARIDKLIALLEEQRQENTNVINSINPILGQGKFLTQISMNINNNNVSVWFGFGSSGEILNSNNFVIKANSTYFINFLKFNQNVNWITVNLGFIAADPSQSGALKIDHSNMNFAVGDASKIIGITLKNTSNQDIVVNKIKATWQFQDQGIFDPKTRAQNACFRSTLASLQKFNDGLNTVLGTLKEIRSGTRLYSDAYVKEVGEWFRSWLFFFSKCQWGGCWSDKKIFSKEYIEQNAVEMQKRLLARKEAIEKLVPAIGHKDVDDYKCPVCK